MQSTAREARARGGRQPVSGIRYPVIERRPNGLPMAEQSIDSKQSVVWKFSPREREPFSKVEG